jgi:hypothetical protein
LGPTRRGAQVAGMMGRIGHRESETCWQTSALPARGVASAPQASAYWSDHRLTKVLVNEI